MMAEEHKLNVGLINMQIAPLSSKESSNIQRPKPPLKFPGTQPMTRSPPTVRGTKSGELTEQSSDRFPAQDPSSVLPDDSYRHINQEQAFEDEDQGEENTSHLESHATSQTQQHSTDGNARPIITEQNVTSVGGSTLMPNNNRNF